MARDLKIENRFLKDTKDHVMDVKLDHGLYRHIRFQAPNDSYYWFDLITIPGQLIIRGDCGTYAFSRIEDMFNFFVMDKSDWNYEGENVLAINPGYWTEKLDAVDRRNHLHVFDEKSFEEQVTEAFNEYWDDNDEPNEETKSEMWEDIKSEVLNAESEEDAHRHLRDYHFSDCPDFEFSDSWEWKLNRVNDGYIWNLYAIVWGIKKYNEWKSAATTSA